MANAVYLLTTIAPITRCDEMCSTGLWLTRIIFYKIIRSRFPERILHNCLYFFRVGGRKEIHHFLNGVHQGLPISLALFDGYMEDVNAEICN
jgi:hypothetical protein